MWHIQYSTNHITLTLGLNKQHPFVPWSHPYKNTKKIHWSPCDSYYWHMYSNFSNCLGSLDETPQLCIRSIRGIGWHHACKPYEPTISRGKSLPRIGSHLIGLGERRQLILTFSPWVNPDKINQKPRHFSQRKPIESLHWGFAAEVN